MGGLASLGYRVRIRLRVREFQGYIYSSRVIHSARGLELGPDLGGGEGGEVNLTRRDRTPPRELAAPVVHTQRASCAWGSHTSKGAPSEKRVLLTGPCRDRQQWASHATFRGSPHEWGRLWGRCALCETCGSAPARDATLLQQRQLEGLGVEAAACGANQGTRVCAYCNVHMELCVCVCPRLWCTRSPSLVCGRAACAAHGCVCGAANDISISHVNTARRPHAA